MIYESIYLISTYSKFKKNEFKLGKHKGSQRKLLSRYQTYLINPVIFYFRPVSDCIKIEGLIKSKLKKKRIKNENGKYTEWIILELHKIILCINEIINQYECDNNIQNKNDFNNNIQNKNDFNSWDSDKSNESDEYTDSILEDYDKSSHETLNDPIGNFMNDCLIISKNPNNRLKISLLAKLLEDYDKSSHETLKSLGQYFKKKDIKITTIKGYLTCSGICLKEYNTIIEKLSADSINTLIDLKLITGEKIEDGEI